MRLSTLLRRFAPIVGLMVGSGAIGYVLLQQRTPIPEVVAVAQPEVSRAIPAPAPPPIASPSAAPAVVSRPEVKPPAAPAENVPTIGANRALELAGLSERITGRSLQAQGKPGKPTIHEGVKSREMHARRARPRSKNVSYRNGRGARARSRDIDYPAIDKGRSRVDYNISVRAQAAPETEIEMWEAIDRDRVSAELDAQRWIHRPDLFGQEGRDGPNSPWDRWFEERSDQAGGERDR